MDDGKRFLILSLRGEGYAVPITKILKITTPRGIQKDAKLSDIFEGEIEYQGKWIPVVSLKKVFKISEKPGDTLLVVRGSKGDLGILVDNVIEILDTEQDLAPMPSGVIDRGIPYYRGILRYKENLVPVLNEDGLLQ